MRIAISPFSLTSIDQDLLVAIRAELMEWRTLARTPEELSALGALVRGLDTFRKGCESQESCEIRIEPADWQSECGWTTFRLNSTDLLLGIGEITSTPQGIFESGGTRLIGLTGRGNFDDEDVRTWINLSSMARDGAGGLEVLDRLKMPPRLLKHAERQAAGWMLNRDDARLILDLRNEIWSWRDLAEDGLALMSVGDAAHSLDQVAEQGKVDGEARVTLINDMSHDSCVTYGVNVEADEIALWQSVRIEADEHTHIRCTLHRDGGFSSALFVNWLQDVVGFRNTMHPVAEGDLFQPEW